MSAATSPGGLARLSLMAVLFLLAAPASRAAEVELCGYEARTSQRPPFAAPDAPDRPPGWEPRKATFHLLAAPPSRPGEVVPCRDEVRYRLQSPFADPDFKAPGVEPRKNSWLALGEVVGINLLMWQASYWSGAPYAKISFSTIGDNFNKGWIIDTDTYWINQFGHPYEGSAFYNAARSTGHGAYESFGFSFLGSLMWEQFMEKQSPSVNDQIVTPGGGSVLGEVLYRMYRLVLDSSDGRPSGWRKVGAFLISPVAGANDLFFGNRYNGPALLPPSWMGEFQAGMVIAGRGKDVNTGAQSGETGPWASVGAHITYGVPGTPDLTLRQPFDHFDFRATFAFTGKALPSASLQIRGLVVGDTISSADRSVGLWGLFASYDVIGESVFKVSGFGLGPGVSLVGTWGGFQLHGTGVAEVLPWAGGGSMHKLYDRDYHYGPGADALVDLRALFGDRVIVDLTAKEYFISGWYATGSSEDITWAHAAVTGRLYGPHALSVSVDWAIRHARYPATPSIFERGEMLLAHYTLLQGW